jgi:hypothetical protein
MSQAPVHNLLTVKETAEYLRIPVPTVYYLVQTRQDSGDPSAGAGGSRNPLWTAIFYDKTKRATNQRY